MRTACGSLAEQLGLGFSLATLESTYGGSITSGVGCGRRPPDGSPYVSNEKCWKVLIDIAKAARWLGYIPFHRIRDERNDA